MSDIQDILSSISRNLQDLARKEALQGDPACGELVSALSRELVAAQKTAKSLVAENTSLVGENRKLKALLAGEHGFDVKNNVYYTPDGDGPFCPFCYEHRGSKQRLRPVDTGNPGQVRHACRVCESEF